MTRTIEDALDRAKKLRDFRSTSPARFESCPDFEDLVNLANEVTRLKAQVTEPDTVAAIVEYLRGQAQVVSAMDGMYGKINAANQIEHEADLIEDRFGKAITR